MRAHAPGPAEFGVLLRRLRVAAELSQEELAGRARMSADAIGALERGRRKAPQRETVDLLLQALAPSDADRAALVGAANRARMRSVEPIAGVEPVPRHNLPNRLTPLIGRESALAEIHAQLGDSRLVTLVGAGGIGKTRLAIEVAAQQLDRWPDGVWFVELGRVNDAVLVAGTIALAVGGVQQSHETALQTLTRHLRHKRTLLLLDNCEHLIAEVARIAHALLAELPVLELLATSRELLRVDGELVYRLSSLSDSSALALFEQRARAVEPDFRMTPQEAPIALEICRRLDGLPLAIELAAARVRTLTPKQLIGKLDARFELLSGGNRAAAPRQQTMRALIDWSYDLLAPAEQRFFRRLAVFAGGFALDGALAVCGGDALNSITSLFDKSMLLAHVSGAERRYVLLESMRDYALEKLGEAGEGDEASRRHVEFIAQLVESLSQRSSNAARAVLAVEIENIRTAISWCIASGEAVELGARILVDSSLLYTQRLYGEYLQRAQFFLSHGGRIDAGVRGRIWLGVARRAIGIPGLEAAERAIELLQQGDGNGIPLVQAHRRRAQTLAHQNRIEEALEANSRARDLRDQLCPQDMGTLASIYHQRGFILGQQHAHAAARAEYEKASAVYEGIGDTDGVAYMLGNAGDCLYREGDVETAARLTSDALAVFRQTRNSDGEAFALCNIAEFQIVGGDWHGAAASITQALGARRTFRGGIW